MRSNVSAGTVGGSQLKTQSVPRSKHTASLLYKPVS